ncbi:MAG: hypothetical protein A2X36_00585 [Elusimicrobia bacterium GWA2_69_24]|nr:MAG: hypothetical protein A2X36_00585 [Elusimicrobia bacterium GWA2_69_24]
MTTEQAYSILGVAPGVSPKDVQLAYRRRALECHPDRARGAEETAHYTRLFMEIRDAYAHLRASGFPVPEPQEVVKDPPQVRTASRSFAPKEGEAEEVGLSEKLGLGLHLSVETVILWGVLIPAGAAGLVWFLRWWLASLRG